MNPPDVCGPLWLPWVVGMLYGLMNGLILGVVVTRWAMRGGIDVQRMGHSQTP